jgi:hypothetical protein
MRDRVGLILLSDSLAVGTRTVRGGEVMDRSCRNVDRQCNSGNADLEQSAMQGAQAGNDARRDPLAHQFGAGSTEPSNAAATTEESADGGGGAPVIVQASKTTLMQQFRWQWSLSERGAFRRSA